MKYSDLLGEWLVELGYTHCFFVAGGGIMHLLDGVRNRFTCIPVVHEVSAGICAEHFNEVSDGKKAFVLVTTGPGLTNVVTAVAGCYVEHRELLVIAGQVKSTDLLKHPERQRGVQEIDGSAVCGPISIESICLKSPIPRSEFRKLVQKAGQPHPGPVLVEVCLDVQGASVDPEKLNQGESASADSLQILPTVEDIAEVVGLLNEARRPLLLLGGLVSRECAWNSMELLERLGLPTATTTSAIDRVSSQSPIFAGRPGTWGGQRAANLVLAQADVLVVIGAQLDLQQTGFNYLNYAPSAKLIHIFPSQSELDRIGPPAAKKILASADQALEKIIKLVEWKDTDCWRDYVQTVRALLPPQEPANQSAKGYINSFEFFSSLSRAAEVNDVLALCSSGGSFTGALQNYQVKPRQVATTSAAHASMGYGLATAIGAAFAAPSRRIILTEGEGGFAQNLQELAVISRFSLPIKIFLMVNKGYASIRATQKKFFNGAYLGCDEDTGLGFPEWQALFTAYQIPSRTLSINECDIDSLRKNLANVSGPEAWIVNVDPNQPNWPAVSTVISSTGALSSSPIFDMLPKLSEELQSKVDKYLPKAKGE